MIKRAICSAKANWNNWNCHTSFRAICCWVSLPL